MRVAQSSTEVEYLALSSAAKKAIFLSHFLVNLATLRLPHRLSFAKAIALSKNPVLGQPLRHLRFEEHAIRERVACKVLTLAGSSIGRGKERRG